MIEGAKAHESKYRHHKDFISNGITDKTKHPGWYVTAMYYAICHMTCYYCLKNNLMSLALKNVDYAYDAGSPLSELYNKYKTFEASKNRTLYTCLCVTPDEMIHAEKLFPEFEEKLLA